MNYLSTTNNGYLVIDCPFNRINYPNLIGLTFQKPPSYAVVNKIITSTLVEKISEFRCVNVIKEN